jgi:hypothetical protein
MEKNKIPAVGCGFENCSGCSPEQTERCAAISRKVSREIVLKDQTCRTCMYAYPVKRPDGVINVGEYLAECHSHPPATIVLPTGQARPGVVSLNLQTKWPYVSDKPGFFCGCWKGAKNDERTN